MRNYEGGRKYAALVRRYVVAEHDAGLKAAAAEDLPDGAMKKSMKAAADQAEKTINVVVAEVEQLQAEDPGTPGADDDTVLVFLRDQFGQLAERVEALEKDVATLADALGADAKQQRLLSLKTELSEMGTRIRQHEQKRAADPATRFWGGLLNS